MAIARFHASRMLRPYLGALGGAGLVLVLVAGRHGISANQLGGAVASAAISAPIFAAIMALRDRADGTLLYLACLAARPRVHALARLIVACAFGALAIPAITAAMRTLYPAFPMNFALIAGTACGVAIAITTLTVVAIAIRAPFGPSTNLVILGFAAAVFVVRWVVPRPGALLLGLVATPIRLATVSGLLWITLAAAGWIAFNSIGTSSARYPRDSA